MPAGDPPLLTFSFKRTTTNDELYAEIFAPQIETSFNEHVKRELSSWRAEYTVRVGSCSERDSIGGENWLQALLLAIEGVRQRIPRGDEDCWLTPDGRPSWVVLPRRVPISWGYEVYREAERAMEAVEQSFIESVNRRRLEQES